MDTECIVRFVDRETRLPSRWRGIVRVETRSGIEWLGRKLAECPIEFHRDVIGDVEMYYVALEESLHSVSVIVSQESGAPRPSREELECLRFVEEAVVGACLELLKPGMRRLFRFDALRKVPLLPDTTRERRYERQMTALGDLRRRAGMEHRSYYWGLLATPLTQRSQQILQWIAVREGRTVVQVAADTDILAMMQTLERE